MGTLIGIAVIVAAGNVCQGADAPFTPTDQYEGRQVDGWTVLVNQRLLTELSALGEDALHLLDSRLYEIQRMVPEPACAELRKVPIWLGVDDGHAPCAEYHPSREWLEANGYNPAKAKCVEIGCAQKFVEWSKQQPMMVLHELAHAYQDRVLGDDIPALREAYEAALAGGKYDAVLCLDRSTRRAYAMENVKEYFAELSESYFGTNDFYPFVRAELEKHDPQGYRVLQELWSPPAAAESR
jgi:hypothetical protein